MANNGGAAVHSARTSSGVFMSYHQDDPVVKKLARKIADWAHVPEENGEIFYLIRYEEGQQYLPHNDFFAHDAGGKKYIGDAGITSSLL